MKLGKNKPQVKEHRRVDLCDAMKLRTYLCHGDSEFFVLSPSDIFIVPLREQASEIVGGGGAVFSFLYFLKIKISNICPF